VAAKTKPKKESPSPTAGGTGSPPPSSLPPDVNPHYVPPERTPCETLPIEGGGLATYAQIPEEELGWLVEELIPRNELVLLAGASGTGKSTFLARLAAHVTTNGNFAGQRHYAPGTVLLYALEECAGGAPLERLRAAGADLRRVVSGDRLPDMTSAPLPYLPDGMAAMRRRIADCRASLLIIDPITSLLGPGVTENDPQHVRGVLIPLQQLARDAGCTVVYTQNYKKATSGDASNWVSGHKNWWNVPRHVLCFGRDPRSPSQYILAVGKQSRGRPGLSRSYRISDRDGGGYFDLLGTSDSTAHDLGCDMDDALQRSARQLAREYLRSVLDTEDQRASRLLTECETAGFSRHTLDRAAADLGVQRKFRDAGGERGWWWMRPEKWPD
jgi:AAA domain